MFRGLNVSKLVDKMMLFYDIYQSLKLLLIDDFLIF